MAGDREAVNESGGLRTDRLVMTWKVNGLLGRIKRGAVMRYLKRKGPAVALLQETHLLGTKCSFLGRLGYDRVYHAGFTRGSRGAAILLHRSLTLTVGDSRWDPGGRFMVVWGLMEGRAYNLVSVYGPHSYRRRHLQI